MHYSGEKKKEEEDINNLINNLLIQERKSAFSFASCNALINIFDRICRVMNKSRSEVLNNLIIDFIKRHRERQGQIELTQFFVKAEAGSQVNIAKKQVILQRVVDRKKEKAQEMLAFALKHVDELPPHSREYYTRLAQENQDLEEALQLIKLLSEKGATEG